MNIAELIENSSLSISAISADFGIHRSTLIRWSRGGKPKNKEKAAIIMDYLSKNTQKIEFHPSWGWATQDQINRLNEIGVCPERDKILKDIAKQTKLKGKLR